MLGHGFGRRIAFNGVDMSEQHRGGTYAPPADDYETFDARDAEQDKRGWLFLAASAVVFVLFVAVVYNTFQLGVRERNASPSIGADAAPYRITPDDPGGYETPDQDLSVTALREGPADAEQAPETPAPAREVMEEPADPPEREMPSLRIEQADADALDEPAEITPDPEPAPPSAPETRPEPQSQAEPPTSTPSTQAADTAESGVYVAQIAAYRSLSDAEAGWLSFVSRYPELAIGRAPDVQRADLGERGVFHRLRIAGFGSREEAAAYCDVLQDRGQACLVTRR